MPVGHPGNGQREEPGDRGKAELSSSPSHRDSMESGGSPSLSPPSPHAPSLHSPSGFPRSAKKRESKGKGKEVKGERRSKVGGLTLTPPPHFVVV